MDGYDAKQVHQFNHERHAMKSELTIDGTVYVPKIEASNRVLVRCRNAGVHVGTLAHRDENTLTLERANRIWKWKGAFTLSEVAAKGVDREESRIACEVPSLTLTVSDVCEVMPVSAGVDLTEANSEANSNE